MKRHVLLIMMTLIAIAIGVTSAQAFNPTGTWKFTLSDSAISGMCPMGNNGIGTLIISKAEGGKYILKYASGMACSPGSVCILSWSCQSGKCSFQTTIPVDNEGGKVTNSEKFTFNGGHASGAGSSIYRHPKCSVHGLFFYS